MRTELIRQIPAQNFGEQFKSLRTEIFERFERICSTGQFVLGQELKELEASFASWVNAKHAVGCASGTDALLLSLMTLGIGTGDEVITTPFTFFATGGSIARSGARPVFVDIDPRTYNMDPDKIEARISPKTKAIMPVHLYGQPCSMDKIMEIAGKHKLFVIEDCAQSHGTKFKGKNAGTFGDFGAFSFYPTKNLGAYGDAGMLVTEKEALAQEIRVLRVHGAAKRYHHDKLGINSRLDELQAAVLNVKLKYLSEWLSLRRKKAQRYNELLKDVRQVRTPYEDPQGFHTYHVYALRAEKRDELLQVLTNAGVQVQVYYPVPLHLEKALSSLGHHEGDYPEAERASLETLALPIYPELTDEDQVYVAEKVREFYSGR